MAVILLSLLALLAQIVPICDAIPMMKSVDEKKVPPAAFWPYILHPTRPQISRHKSEEREDYYDAVRDEDGTSMAPTTAAAKTEEQKEAEEEAKQLQQMMALLFANVDPVPMLTASGGGAVNAQKLAPKATAPHNVPPPPRRRVPTTKTAALPQQPSTMLRKVDAETYDDERAEAGKDDEEISDEEEEDDEQEQQQQADNNKVLMMKRHKLDPMLMDGMDSDADREANAEADGVQQVPTKGVVDGQTHFLIDSETGGDKGFKMVSMRPAVDGEVVAKRKGAAQFPKPPMAEIVRMGQ